MSTAAQRSSRDALRGGDVASVIVPQYGLDDRTFQKHAEKLVPLIQDAGAAALIAGDSRVAGRVKADGLHVTGNAAELAEAIEKFAPKLIVGGGNATDRHHALEIGEVRPDYIFFGKLDGDIKPEAHPKNVALGRMVGLDDRDSLHRHGRHGSGIGARRRRKRSGVRGVAAGGFRRAGTGAGRSLPRVNAFLTKKRHGLRIEIALHRPIPPARPFEHVSSAAVWPPSLAAGPRYCPLAAGAGQRSSASRARGPAAGLTRQADRPFQRPGRCEPSDGVGVFDRMGAKLPDLPPEKPITRGRSTRPTAPFSAAII